MNIRYFAWLRQRTGVGQETVEPPESVTTVAQLIEWLGEKHPRFAEACQAAGVVRCAVNKVYVERDAQISADDEVAFFPPVTGG